MPDARIVVTSEASAEEGTGERYVEASTRQTAILEAIAGDVPLPEVLDQIARHIEAELPGARCVLRAHDAEVGAGTAGGRVGAHASGDDPPNGWSTAILGPDDALLGTCVVHHPEQAAPGEAERQLVASATRLARIALARAAGVERERRATRRFRALVEHTSELITVVARDGTMTYVSPAAHVLLGLPESALVGRPAIDLVHPDDEALVSARLDALLRGEVLAARAEYRWRRADGSWLQLATVAENLLDDPAVQGIVINSRDVTERASLEAQLRQAQRMEALGHLAGGVAHDFNNLLLVIQASAGFVSDAVAPGSVAAEDLAELRRAADRAADLTRQLLAFSRQQMLRPREVQLSDVVGGLRAMLRRLLEAGVALEISHRPAAGPALAGVADVVHADPGQLEQVIVNLVVNARDAIDEHGTIRLRTSVEHVPARDPARPGLIPGRYATLAVIDDGHGMDAATLARIFEPFFTTKAQGKGTGLGLATVYGIIKQSGGYVYATSAPGRGTTFTVLLPLVEGGPASGAERPATAPGETAARGEAPLLLVEDEREVRRTVRKMLERAGYRVLEATDGRAALALLEGPDAPRVAAVVSDVVMPEMSGRELVAALRQRAPGLPALLLSGYAAEAVMGNGVLVPGVEVLGKPFRAEELLTKVRALLKHASAAQE
jgi:PAS domain S-box-containing protein